MENIIKTGIEPGAGTGVGIGILLVFYVLELKWLSC